MLEKVAPPPPVPVVEDVWLDRGCIFTRADGALTSLEGRRLPDDAVQLRVTLPEEPWTGAAPLAVRGAPRAADAIGLQWDGTNMLLLHDHYGVFRVDSAPIPAECETAITLAQRTATLAVDELATVRDGMLIFLDGELPEVNAILRNATLGVEGLQVLQARLATAADACLGS